MKALVWGFLVFHGALSCLALEQRFSEICNADLSTEDCLEYEQRGLAYVICRWWHFLPSLRELDLISQRNPIYIFSLPYCEAWLKSEPSTLIPDVEGNYCKDDGVPADPKEIVKSDAKRAFLCAKHAQAENYLRAKALSIITKVVTDSSLFTMKILNRAQEYFENNKTNIEQEYNSIFNLEYNFPHKETKFNWPKFSLGLW